MGHTKDSDGLYHIRGKTYEILCGSRAQVWHGTAYKTSGGLTKEHLLQNKNGRIVSKKKHTTEKKGKRLLKHGYTAKKGQFGPVKIGSRSSRSMSRGGMSPSTSMPSIKNMPTMKPAMVKGGFQASESHSSLSSTMVGGKRRNSRTSRGKSRTSRGGKCGIIRGGHSSLSPASLKGGRMRGGLAPLQMTSLSDAGKGIGVNVPYPSQNPLTRALNAS